MQTIQKRKQWVLIALALIATLTLQLLTPITAHAEETSTDESRTITIPIKYTCYKYSTPDVIDLIDEENIIVGSGVFVTRSFYKNYDEEDTSSFIYSYVFSDMPFTVNDNSAILYNGVYYYNLESSYGGARIYTITSVPNISVGKNDETSTTKYLIDNGVIDLSKDDYEELVFDESTATYNSDIPTPKLTVNNDYSFGFNNASDGYYIQIKGRWYSVDDIELYKENLQWKYKYNSILKGSLTDWVSSQSNISVISDSLNFSSFGQSAFDSFLSTYPIDNRSYTGGTNALGNFFSGYNDALSTLKMLLGQPTSIYNGLEVYVRYYTFDANGNAIYGKWCHYYDNLASSTGSSGSQWDDSENMFTGNQSENGLDDEQFTTVENMTDSRNDIDLVPEYNNSGFESIVLGNVDTTSLVSTLESMYTQTSSFINMIGTVFNFLPSWVIAMICASLGLVCIIGMWKCIKG